MATVSVAAAKGHLADLIARSEHNHERFVITRHKRPVAALVSLNDLRIIEQHEERQGLATIAGAWPGFEEIADAIGDLIEFRRQGGDSRDVSL